MQDYPPLEHVEDGRLSLRDYFSEEEIELDRMVYVALGLHNEYSLIEWEIKQYQQVLEEQAQLLEQAYLRFLEICDREQILTFEQFDERHLVHYFCQCWISELFFILRELIKSMILK